MSFLCIQNPGKHNQIVPDYVASVNRESVNVQEDVQQNNEVFLTWLVKKEKFPLTQLPEWWHYNCLKSDNKIANACMWHVTDKNFERVFRLVNF